MHGGGKRLNAVDCTAAQEVAVPLLASGMGNTVTARTKAAIAEQKKFSALLKMLRAGLR